MRDDYPRDPVFVDMMQTGSANLLRATNIARAGLDPKTSKKPVGLPPAWKQRGLADARKLFAYKGCNLSLSDMVAELVSREFTIPQCAEALNSTYTSCNAAFQRIRQNYGEQAR